MADTDPASKNWQAFTRAWSGHKDYVAEAERFNAFYLGDQWDEHDRQILESEGRPVLTLNECMQVINAVRGHYGMTRADIQYKPLRQGASCEVAHTLTRLTDQIFDANNFISRVEPQVFTDGIIEDRGFFDVRVDFSDNILGEVRITDLNPRMVLIDPEATDYDPATWNEVTVNRWMTLNDIEAYYGKHMRRKVESVASNADNTYGDLSVKYETFDDKGHHPPAGFQEDQHSIRAVRVLERQHRKMSRVRELVDPTTGDTRIIPDHWEDDRAELLAAEYGYKIRKRVRSRIRWTVSADHITLHDDWSPYSEFTVVPYFPMFRRGRPSGLMRHLVDPQEQLNKIESQILHTINTTANSGWLVESGSLVNMTEQDLERRGAESGLVLIHARNREKPEKIQPNPMPTGLENYAQKSNSYIQSIPGIASLMGQEPKSAVSGVALGQAQDKALLGLQVVFDNLQFTRKLVAKRILDCVQTYYTEERVFHVTEWRNPEEPDVEVRINEEDTSGEVVNDITVGKYEVTVGSTPTRDTFEEMQFAQILEMRKAGVMVPDHHVIKHSQLQGKDEIAEQVKQMEGLGEPDEAQLKMQELQMAKAEADLAYMQAQIAELESRAQHNAAKAQTEVAGEEREQTALQNQYAMEIARLKADLEKKRADIENKIDIAQIHSGVKNSLTRYQKLFERREREKDRDLELAKEGLRDSAMLEQQRIRGQSEIQKTALQGMQRPQPSSEPRQ